MTNFLEGYCDSNPAEFIDEAKSTLLGIEGIANILEDSSAQLSDDLRTGIYELLGREIRMVRSYLDKACESLETNKGQAA